MRALFEVGTLPFLLPHQIPVELVEEHDLLIIDGDENNTTFREGCIADDELAALEGKGDRTLVRAGIMDGAIDGPIGLIVVVPEAVIVETRRGVVMRPRRKDVIIS